jgi:PKHD-type hydroxylase
MLECIPDVLAPKQIAELMTLVEQIEFIDGKKTAGYRAKRVKNNEQLTTRDDTRKQIDKIVTGALRANPTFKRVVLPRKIHRPLISRYREGMNYGLHVDDARMGTNKEIRTDMSCTLFLSDPAEYDGGELQFKSPFGEEIEVKLPAGSAVVYPSSTLHQVLPVTRGERLAAVTWIQSLIRSPEQRAIMNDLVAIQQKLQKMDPEAPETDLAFQTYANLMRMWSDG